MPGRLYARLCHTFLVLFFAARVLLVLEKPQAYYVLRELFWVHHIVMPCWNLMLQMTGVFYLLRCCIRHTCILYSIVIVIISSMIFIVKKYRDQGRSHAWAWGRGFSPQN